MERGFFKIWRKIEDSQSYNRSALHRAILLTIFVKANWKGGFFCGRQVAPGQIATSVKGLAEELREPRTNVMRALRDLEKDGVIKIENVGNKWTMITLVNWNSYQARDEKSGQPSVNQRSTSGQPVDTIKKGKKERKKEKEEGEAGEPAAPPDVDPELLDFARKFQNEVAITHGNTAPKITDALIVDGALELERAVRIDGLEINEIKSALMWAVHDDFWGQNLKSMARMRTKTKAGVTKIQSAIGEYRRHAGRSNENRDRWPGAI